MLLNENLFLWERLQAAQKPIVLYGMGNGADKVLRVCGDLHIPVAGVFASPEFCRGHLFRGYPVTGYEQARAAFGSMIVLLCFGTARNEVMQAIESIAAEQELYAPDLPVYGDELFDRAHFAQYREQYAGAYAMLADAQSQKTFTNILNYRASGCLQYLRSCEVSAEDAFAILRLSGHETYLDAGAYTGDTVLAFLRRVTGYTKIIAAEPDAKNFAKLTQNTSPLQNTVCLRLAVSGGAEKIAFSSRAGRHSSAGGPLADTVAADSIDNILCGEAATFIKLDVEGMEAQALAGAAHTIAAYRPKMQIAAYHRTGDLFDIPLQMKKIRPDYKVYLRHTPCFPAWDTWYYFV